MMPGLVRTTQLLGIYIQRQFLEWLAWRSFLITLVINQAITPLLGLAVWSVALPGQPAIAAYYVILLAVQLLTVSYEQHTFSNDIYAGGLTDSLLVPHPVVYPILGTNLALRLWHILAGLPLILIAGAVVRIHLDGSDVLAALPALVLAGVLRFLFTYILALSAFWTERAHGVVGLGETLIFLLGGSAAPVTLFRGGLRLAGEILPFRAMLGFPAEIASGSLGAAQIGSGYALQIVWISLFAGLAVLVWKSGLRRYAAVGG